MNETLKKAFDDLLAQLVALPRSRESSVAITNVETGKLWAEKAPGSYPEKALGFEGGESTS